jgi:hypothetical protein
MKTAIELATRLCNIADAMTENRTTQIGDHAIRTLRDEVRCSRMQLSQDDFAIDYEASCLIDCIAELAYARTDGDKRREERALMYVNCFRAFLRMDVNRAERHALTS